MVTNLPGSGRFLLWLAKQNSDFRNYLGLEIRQKVGEHNLIVVFSEISVLNLKYLLLLPPWPPDKETLDLFLMFGSLVQLVKRAQIWVKELVLNNM